MTGLDVLAAALYSEGRTGPQRPTYADLPDDVQQAWRDRARVIQQQMAEADHDASDEGENRATDPLAGLTLAGAVELAQAAAEQVNRTAVATAVDVLDAVAAIRLLDQLRDATDILRAIDNTLERHIYLTGEHGQQVVEGIGQVMVGRARDRKKWDERGVARAVIDQRMAERGGEVPDDPWDVAEWLLEVFGINYARVNPLRALGLEPKAFCEESIGRVQVSLPPR